MPEPTTLNRFRVVLSCPSHPGNIGAAARAMKTMGLSRLFLVQPKSFPDSEASVRASGATDILESATICQSLVEALNGVSIAAALTSRRRELSLPVQWAHDAASSITAAAIGGAEIALVFGNETYGLSNQELSLCQLPVMIPTNPEYSSLNLGSAVQVMCYEVRRALLGQESVPVTEGRLATVDETEKLIAHFESAMTASGFFDPSNPKRLMPKLRRMFGRIKLEQDEVNILRGMLASFAAQTSAKR